MARREPEAAAADGGGPAAFRDWLDAGGAGEPPRRLLDDPAASEAVHPVIEIEERAFASRYELVGFLVGLLEPLDVASVRFDGGLWDLLSPQSTDIVAPAADGTSRELKDRLPFPGRG